MDNSAENCDKNQAPIVSIDGAAIKRIREGSKLTQLYVASVVGVTTDTISRWENNRYPTIKRDNAEKLAGALDVSLDAILQKEAVEEPEAAAITPVPPARGRLWLVVAGIFAVIAVAGFFLLNQRETFPPAVRWLPQFAAPGTVIPVQIKISRKSPESRGFIVRERIPAGWRFVSSSPATSSMRPDAEEIKWLIPDGSGTVTLSYTVKVPQQTVLGTRYDFSGKLVLASGGIASTQTIGGDTRVTVSGYHWADRNGDGRIDDNEIMPAYYLNEEMKGLGLEWKTLETIWNSPGYSWNPKSGTFDSPR